MRDILTLLFFIICVYFIYKSPKVGFLLSLWSSLFTPNLLAYSYSKSIRFNFFFLVLSSIFLLLRKTSIPFKYRFSMLDFLIILLAIWGTLSSFFNSDINVITWIEWDFFIKAIAIYPLSIIFIRKIRDVHYAVIFICISVPFIGLIESLKFLISGGSHIITGIYESKLQDRNAFALSLNMCLPLLVYLFLTAKKFKIKLIVSILLTASVICIIGSFSRGGFIGLITFLVILFFNSKNKIRNLLIITPIILITSNFVPSAWTDRMNTIETAGEDESFLGRVVAWKTTILIAAEHPILGVGFKGAQLQPIWTEYSHSRFYYNGFIDTSNTNFEVAKAAHSIYFQTLGDLGYVGLFIYLSILFFTLIYLLKCMRYYKDDLEYSGISKAIFQSILIFGVAGAALSLQYFDLIFIMISLSRALILLRDNMDS